MAYKKNDSQRLSLANSTGKLIKSKSAKDNCFKIDTKDMTSLNIFEEIKSSLQHKALQNDKNISKHSENLKKTVTGHKKNTVSFAKVLSSNSTRKSLGKPSTDTKGLAVVSSFSALSQRKDKLLSIFH